MKIYYVRHGQTNWNLSGTIQGKIDNELNKTGEEQAKEAGEKLKNEKIDLIICSPLKRTRKTAEIINKNFNVKTIYKKGLEERDFGEFEGTSKYDLDTDTFWNYKLNKQYEKAESVKEIFERVYKTLDEIINKYKDKNINILIVAHGGVSVPFKCYFEGIPEEKETLKDLIIRNGNIISYEII